MPARLGRYAVRRRIGSGGFATVWLAYDEQLDSPVAVKVLAENWTEDAAVRKRFLEEGRFLRKVESPHVVTVYDAGELDDGRPYLVMSYADQGTLADRLELQGFTVHQSLEVVRQVAEGLAELHRRGVLHRDVKPANVLFRAIDGGPDGGRVRAMIGDLGLGKALDVSSRLTMIAGTPSYVAPEQAQGEHLDARADQYSLGALTHLLLTGRAPYSHATLKAAAEAAAPPPLSTPDRPFPPEVEHVVARAMAPERADRWPDVTTYAEALSDAFTASYGETREALPWRWLPVDPQLTQAGRRPTPAPEAGPLPEPAAPPVKRRRWPAAVLSLVLLAAGLYGGYTWWRGTHDQMTRTDMDGVLSVTVPRDWDGELATAGWTPPNGTSHAPALAVGDSSDWATTGQGVFVGLLRATELPTHLPQHQGCTSVGEPVRSKIAGDPASTTTYAGCRPGVVIERVVQVTGDQLLWVQVRSSDLATAHAVLASVRTRGIF
ncbi:MAG: protein kinase domain-containing protein [Nocardioides sp.]